MTTAFKPDLDWSQVRETMMLLNVAVAQIEASMSEGDDSVNSLAEAFIEMTGPVEMINRAIADIDKTENNQFISELIKSSCHDVAGKIQQTIIALQFYDRLVQRLSHVSHNLEELTALIGNQDRIFNPYEWQGLQEKIKAAHSMAEERDLFDAIKEGKTLKEALALVAKNNNDEDELELF